MKILKRKIFGLSVCSTSLLLSASFTNANAGSVSDVETQSNDFSCDKRRVIANDPDFDFCNENNRNKIGDSCYVVVHSEAITGRRCSWQGCGALSLIGKPAQLKNYGQSFEEYSVETPRNGAPYLDSADRQGVLPQRPYKRHYLTVRTAADAIRGCPMNIKGLPSDVHQVLCNADKDIMRINPYWSCFISK
jgi:hypothetical protein